MCVLEIDCRCDGDGHSICIQDGYVGRSFVFRIISDCAVIVGIV